MKNVKFTIYFTLQERAQVAKNTYKTKCKIVKQQKKWRLHLGWVWGGKGKYMQHKQHRTITTFTPVRTLNRWNVSSLIYMQSKVCETKSDWIPAVTEVQFNFFTIRVIFNVILKTLCLLKWNKLRIKNIWWNMRVPIPDWIVF